MYTGGGAAVVVVLVFDFMADMGFCTVGELVEATFKELFLGTVCNFSEIFFGLLMLSTLGALGTEFTAWVTLLFVGMMFVGLEISFGRIVVLGESLVADFVVRIFLVIVGTILIGLDRN